jgi:hypothetical protein
MGFSVFSCCNKSRSRKHKIFIYFWFFFVFSCYNNNTRGRNFYWLFFKIKLLRKGYEVFNCIMVFTLCFLKAKEYKVQQKKRSFSLNMFFLQKQDLEVQ